MNYTKSFVLFIALLAVSPLYGQQMLRVMSYNVHNCIGGDVRAVNTERIGRVIAAANPDLAGLQELDYKTKRRCGRDILAEVAAAAKMEYQYAPAYEISGGLYGVGSLTKQKPLSVRKVLLPGRKPTTHCVLHILEYENFVFFVTHLPLVQESRNKSIPIINAERDKYDKPVILTADLNEKPDSPLMKEVFKTWQNATSPDFTFSAKNPRIHIDYILVSTPDRKPVRVLEARVIDEPLASDHRPVLSVIELP